MTDADRFQEIRATVAGARSSGPDLVVELRCDALDPPVTWQVYRSDTIVGWVTESPGEVDLLVEHDNPRSLFGFPRAHDGTDEHHPVRLGVNAETLGPIPPFDTPTRGEPIAHATITIDLQMRFSPAGHVVARHRFRDGEPYGRLDEIDDAPADLTIRGSYHHLIGYSGGRCDLYDVIEAVDIDGTLAHTALSAGLLSTHVNAMTAEETFRAGRAADLAAHLRSTDHQLDVVRRTLTMISADR